MPARDTPHEYRQEVKYERRISPSPAPGAGLRLFAQTETIDYRQVAVTVCPAKVGQQAGPVADHLQEAAPTGVVFLVRAHVLVQLVDACREQGNLHLG